MSNVSPKQLVEDLGLTRDQVAEACGKVYLQGYADSGRDYHSEFADALGCTRNQAKEVSYWFQYTTPYMQALDRLSRQSTLNMVRTKWIRNQTLGNTSFDLPRYLDMFEGRYEQDRSALMVGQHPSRIQA